MVKGKSKENCSLEFNLRELLLIANALIHFMNSRKPNDMYQEYMKIIQKIYDAIREARSRE